MMPLIACAQIEPGADLEVVHQGLALARAPITPQLPDKTTDAALQYLLTSDPDAWDHLIKILMQAKGNLFLYEPGLPLLTATRRFYEVWLANKIAPYREADADAICAAAETGEFRYLGKQAKNALIDEIRRRYTAQDALDQHLSEEEWWARRPPRLVSLDAPLSDDEDFTLADLLAIDPSQGNPATSKLPSALGRQPGLEPEALQRAMREGKREFKRLLGPLHDVLVTVCGLFVTSPDDLHPGDAAGAVAAARGISVQTARRKLRQLGAIFRRALQAGNPTVRDFYRMLTTPGRPTFWINDRRSGRPCMA
jgi:hypothetical protein